MKKAPHKIPWEIRDPKPEPPVCTDLSDHLPPPPGPAAPQAGSGILEL